MEKVTLSLIQHSSREKNDGGKFENCSIKVEEREDVWISGYASETTYGWRLGDVVELEIEEKEVGENVYLNFKTPSKEVLELRERNSKLETELAKEKGVEIEDLPF